MNLTNHRNIKRLLTLTSALMALCLLAGCAGGGGSTESDPEKISVVTTIFAPYDFTREIAGDAIELRMLLPPGAESHAFEPTAADILAIQNCDLFIYVGGESETWVERILSTIDTDGINIISLMDIVEVVEEELVEGMQSETEHEEHEHESVEYDEHVWTSPQNAILIAEKISETLVEIDPENADIYSDNTSMFVSELEALDAEFSSVLADSARQVVVFGDRFPFRYFTESYGLSYFAAFPGCSAETEPSAATVKFLIDKVRSEGIPVVFHIELSSSKIAETIAEATGAEVLVFYACHGISRGDFETGVGYLELMRLNVEALRVALSVGDPA